MSAPDARGVSALLKDFESPLEEVRVAALAQLGEVPSLAMLRAVRRLAATDPSVEVRSRARQLLEVASRTYAQQGVGAQEADETSIQRVRDLLSDPDPATRAQVIRGLAMNLDPGVPVLLASVLPEERDPHVICILLQGLAATAGSAAELAEKLLPYLRHSDHRVRATAVESLEAVGDPRLLAHLLPLLEDPHHRVRAAVARALQAQEREAVLATVDAMLGSIDEMSVRAATYVLRFFDEETALTRLRQPLASERPGVRQMSLASLLYLARKGSKGASRILSRMAPGETIPPGAAEVTSITPPVTAALEARLGSEDYEQRVGAILEAVRAARDDLLPLLRGMVATETSSRVLATLAAGLGVMGGELEAASLVRLLSFHEPRVRANAVESIGVLLRGRAGELLSRALNDENNRVRANAVVALHGTPGIDVMPALEKMATHTDSRFVRSAIWAAGAMATPEAVQILTSIEGAGGDHAVAARDALRSLAPVVQEAALATAGDSTPVTIGRAAAGDAADTPRDDAERQRLVFDLRHDSPAIRLQALTRIAASGDPGLIRPVRSLLQDDDPAVRRAARAGIRSLLVKVRDPGIDPEVLEAFDLELAGGPERARRVLGHVIDITLKCGMGIVAAMLAGRLPIESDPYVRAQILSALALVGERDIAGIVQAFLRDPDARVRANALDALDLLTDGAGLRAVTDCLADPDPRVRSAAITMSIAAQGEPFFGHLKEMLVSESIAERAAGLYALSAIDIPERYDLLKLYFLAETQPRLYEACAEALAPDLAMRPDELEGIAENLPEGEKRHYLRIATYRLRDDLPGDGQVSVGRPIARAGMESVSWILDMKKGGMLGAGEIRTALQEETDPLAIILLLESAREQQLPDVLDLAVRFTHSKDRRLRLAAAEAVGALNKPEASEMLAVLVRDRDAEVSRRAVESLLLFDARAARAGVRALLDPGQTWGIQRGLELLEKIEDPEGIHLVLDLLTRAPGPALTEPITRLVLAWGDAASLERIVGLAPAARPSERALIREVGRRLGTKLGLTEPELAALFPPPPALQPGSSKIAGAPLARPPARPLLLVTVVTASAALLLAMTRSGEPIGGSGAGDGSFASIAAHHLKPDPIGAPPHPRGPGAAGLPSRLLTPARPATRESELERVGALLARSGITHPALLEVLALDSLHADYRVPVIEARNLALQSRFSESIRLLETTLASLDPKHLLGRMRALLALEATFRLAGRGQDLEKTREQLRLTRQALASLCAGGAQAGTIPPARLESLLARLEAYCRLQRPTQDPALWLLR